MSLNFHIDKQQQDIEPEKDRKVFFFTVFILFLWTEGFLLSFLTPLVRPDFYALRSSSVLFLAAIAIFKFISLKTRRVVNFSNDFYFLAIMGIIIVASIPTFLTGTLRFGQSLIEVPRRTFLFYSMLSIYILFYQEKSKKRIIININRAIVLVGIILLVFCIFIAFFPERGFELIDTKGRGGDERFGFIRVGLGSQFNTIIFYAGIFSIVKTFKSIANRNRLSIVMLLSSGVFFYFLFFVFISRRIIIAAIATFVVFLLSYFYNLSIRRRIKNSPVMTRAFVAGSLLILLAVILSISFDEVGHTIRQTISSVDEEFSQKYGTVGIRMEGMSYFWREFKKTDFIGFGLITELRSELNPVTSVRYNFRDHGWIGTFFQFGFPGIALLLLFYRRMLKTLNSYIKYCKDGDLNLVAHSCKWFIIFMIFALDEALFHTGQALLWGLIIIMISGFDSNVKTYRKSSK